MPQVYLKLQDNIAPAVRARFYEKGKELVPFKKQRGVHLDFDEAIRLYPDRPTNVQPGVLRRLDPTFISTKKVKEEEPDGDD